MSPASDSQTILSLTNAEYRLQHLSPSGQPFDKIVVGAIIFYSSHTNPPNILLLKRAAHETVFPNVFELPSGIVKDTDASLYDGLEREVREETDSSIASVQGMVEPMFYAIERKVDKDGQEMVVTRTTVQINLICEVSGDKFRVNPDERSEGQWASASEAAGLDITDEMRVIVRNAFDWREAQLELAQKETVAS